MRSIARAMADPDGYALRMTYRDAEGSETMRVVSPIRFMGQSAFLALCLGRQEPRRFVVSRCSSVSLVPSNDVLMPEPVTEREP